MVTLERILAIPELDPTYNQMGISGKSGAKIADMMGKKSMMKGDKKMSDDGDGEDDEDESDDEDDIKMKKMRDRLKKLKGKGSLKLPTGSMTKSDTSPKSVKDNY